MSLKDEVYAAIREDFKQKGGASFLVSYLQQEKERHLEKYLAHRERDQKRRDPYVALLFHYQNIRDSHDVEGKKQYLKALAMTLAHNSRLNLGSIEQQILETRSGMDGVFSEKRRDSRKYEQMLSLLCSDPPSLPMPELERLHRDVLFRLLMQEGKTLLYDAIDAGKGNEGTSGRKPKVDRMLDLFCDYLQQKDISTLSELEVKAGTASAVSGTTEEDWENLLTVLNGDNLSEDEQTNALGVVLPVLVDPESGASVYIVGCEHFSDSKEMKAKVNGKNCWCIGFYPNDFGVRDVAGAGKSFYPEIHFLWEDGENSWKAMFYPSVHEAFSWYKKVLLLSARENVQETNGPAPKGCPKALRSYFSAST